MTKGELRKARKAAIAAGLPLTGELAIPGQKSQMETGRFARARNAQRKYASREEQNARYIDCGPAAWDDRD